MISTLLDHVLDRDAWVCDGVIIWQCKSWWLPGLTGYISNPLCMLYAVNRRLWDDLVNFDIRGSPQTAELYGIRARPEVHLIDEGIDRRPPAGDNRYSIFSFFLFLFLFSVSWVQNLI